MATRKGRCLCGQTTFEQTGKELWCGHCHCESCRRNTSSPFTTFFGVPRDACRFTGSEPGVYRSSDGVRRLFCVHCGSPMAYESDRYPREIHLYAATLENPDDVSPQFHVYWAEKLPWVALDDGLPRHERGGGS